MKPINIQPKTNLSNKSYFIIALIVLVPRFLLLIFGVNTDQEVREENICGTIEANLWLYEDTGRPGPYNTIWKAYQNAGCDKIYQ